MSANSDNNLPPIANTTRDNPFGFGAFTFPTQPTPPGPDLLMATDVATLKAHLMTLADATRTRVTVLTLAANVYDFTSDPVQKYTIRAKNVTIQSAANARVVLQNFGLLLELDSIDNILIQDILFRSNGNRDSTHDAIELTANKPTGSTTNVQRTDVQAHVRITHCSFDGYFDICVDSRSYAGAPQLRATIDQCLFFDANPGKPNTAPAGETILPFTNRGAINFGSLEDPNNRGGAQLVGNALVTVAYNVFVDIWRRCPRIATANFGHIYNNFLYQWGIGSLPPGIATQGTNTWRGMEIGGGDGVLGGGTNGTALIQANRFIPWEQKKAVADAIEMNTNTMVDLGPAFNEFDKPNGKVSATQFPASTPLTDTRGIDRTSVTVPDAAGWKAIIKQSGPRGGRVRNKADNDARKTAKNALP
jgi:pectate lyase